MPVAFLVPAQTSKSSLARTSSSVYSSSSRLTAHNRLLMFFSILPISGMRRLTFLLDNRCCQPVCLSRYNPVNKITSSSFRNMLTVWFFRCTWNRYAVRKPGTISDHVHFFTQTTGGGSFAIILHLPLNIKSSGNVFCRRMTVET